MASNSDIFQQVRAAVDIVEVIGEHVALKRAGREFKGLCPFHPDHRPSMAVVPHKQIFHCFVCGTGGDVFKFMEQYHKMGKGEVLRTLAQRAGIKLPELPRSGRGGGGPSEGPSIREQIAATNEWACSFFEKALREPSGAKGLSYLKSRGLTDETIARFRLGWAPEGWTTMVTAALRLGIRADALEQAGLVKKRQDGSPYDIFRGRVIFPIVDATGGGGNAGRVIAFGGRVLEEKRDEAGNVVEAKYLNSPETRLFNKSESIYGLNHARQQIVRTRTAVVVEGYMDVIASHQAGVTNVIATLGTALTPEHARALKNYAQTIVLVFDSDDAGFRAAERAMDVFVRTQLEIKLTNVPNGKDPCDFCMNAGGDAFQKIIDAAPDAMTYQWARLQKNFHATHNLGARQEAVTSFMRFVAAGLESGGGAMAMDPVRRGLLFSKLAGLVGVRVEEVGEMLKRVAAGPRYETQTPKDESRNPDLPRSHRIEVRTLKGLAKAEGMVLGSLLVEPALYDRVREEMSILLFVTLRGLAATLIEYLENHPDPTECSLVEVTSELGDEELVRQAIELERWASEWLDPQLSPSHVKMLQQSRGERGLTQETVLRDALKQLQDARGGEDPGVTADLGDDSGDGGEISEEDRKLKELQGLLEKKRRGEDLGNIGLGR